MVATILIMADLSRHVLQDTGVWPEDVVLGMTKSDLVIGLQPSSLTGDVEPVTSWYSPENNGNEWETGSLAINNTSLNDVTVDGVRGIQMCFSRPVKGGHYEAKDDSFVIWSIGSHSGSILSARHTSDPGDMGDFMLVVDWSSGNKDANGVRQNSLTLSEEGATNTFSITWENNNSTDVLNICATAAGSLLHSSSAWLSLGFVEPLGIGSRQYILDPPKCTHATNEQIACLSTIGIVFTLCFTYTGFVLLAVATMWNANIVDKIKKMNAEWNRIRMQQRS